MIFVFLSSEIGSEHSIEHGILLTQIFLSESISKCKCVEENHTEREGCADEQNGNIYHIKLARYVVRVAFMSQMWNLGQSKQAESEECGAECEVDEFNDGVDNLVKPFTKLITDYYSASQDEASDR